MPKKFTGAAEREFKIRVPAGVGVAIEQAAAFNRRTFNAEINERLVHSFGALAEEALRLTFPSEAEPLIGAYRQRRLKLAPADIKLMKAALSRWVDLFNTALEG